MNNAPPQNNRLRSFSLLRQFHSLNLIHYSVRPFRFNWGILEEIERQQIPYIITCRWTEILYCFFAFNRYRSSILINETAKQNVITGFLEKLKDRAEQTPNLFVSEDVLESSIEKWGGLQKLWIPTHVEQKEQIGLTSKMVQFAQANKLPIVPVGFSSTSSFSFFLPNGIQFPGFFSRVALCVGNPLQMENIPVDQACPIIQQALHHLDELAKVLLPPFSS